MMAHSETFGEMTKQLMRAADELCAGRLAACHEGGYSPSYVPFCGLAVVEALSGIRTEVVDPMLPFHQNLGGQALQPHQDLAIEAAREAAGLNNE